MYGKLCPTLHGNRKKDEYNLNESKRVGMFSLSLFYRWPIILNTGRGNENTPIYK